MQGKAGPSGRSSIWDSLRFRLTAIIILVVVLVTGVGTALDYRRQRRMLIDEAVKSLEDQARTLALGRRQSMAREDLGAYVDELCSVLNSHVSPGHYILVLDRRGEVMARSREAGQTAVERALVAADTGPPILDVQGRQLAQFRLAQEDGVTIVMAQYLDHVNENLGRLLVTRLLSAITVAAGIILLISLAIQRWAIRPIGRLLEVASVWAAQDFRARAELGGSSELRLLGQALNAMAQRLQAHEQDRAADLQDAKAIQRNLLPRFVPPVPGLNAVAEYWPLEHVAGDLYDVFELPDGRIVAVILDVAGHGVSAALLTGVVRMSLRYRFDQNPNLTEALRAVNTDLLACTLGETFVVACVGLWDPANRTWTHAGVGHLGCTVLTEGSIRHLDSTGPVLGMLADAEWSCESIQLQEGDRVFLYTDGVTEAGMANDDLLGASGVEAVLASSRGATLGEQVDLILREVAARSQEGPTDDTAIVAFEVSSEGDLMHATRSSARVDEDSPENRA